MGFHPGFRDLDPGIGGLHSKKVKELLKDIKNDEDISNSAKKARIDILKSLVRLGAVPDVTCHKKILDPKAVVIVSGFPVHMGSGGGLGFIWPFLQTQNATKSLPSYVMSLRPRQTH